MTGSDVFLTVALVACTALTTSRIGGWLRLCLARLLRASPIALVQLPVLVSIPALAVIAALELWMRLRDGLDGGGAALVVVVFFALLGNGIGLRHRSRDCRLARPRSASAPRARA